MISVMFGPGGGVAPGPLEGGPTFALAGGLADVRRRNAMRPAPASTPTAISTGILRTLIRWPPPSPLKCQ